MAAAASSEVSEQEKETQRTKRQRPCRVCSDFKTWAKAHSRREKKDRMVKEQGDDRECPVDREELGRATWTFLHTTAAYYPDHASARQQQEMTQLLRALSNFYPCDDCAHHLRAWVKKHPPRTDGRNELSQWMCEMHNDVNQRLDKPRFDCSRVDERWLDGWKDGSCD